MGLLAIWNNNFLSPDQTAEIAAAKQVIYDGFKAALRLGAPEQKAGILTDEQFGAAILLDASAQGYTTACAVEKSGRAEFDFEYGEDFAAHLEKFRPSFAKALLRYNPGGDGALNAKQAAWLARVSDYVHRTAQSHFMIELLVPPEKAQIEKLGGDQKAYDRELRPQLMIGAIQELQHAGVEPDIWKVEGLERRNDCEAIVAARHEGREQVSCIVLGRGEDEQKVHEWLVTASQVPGFIGFAVGRTDFWSALVDWKAKKSTREEAANRIARRYREFAHTFDEKARAA